MRATELLASAVYDRTGGRVGDVRDVRLAHERDGTFRVVGLVVGEGPLAEIAHAWGFAEGRASGPWLFRKLLEPASRQARFVPAEDVADWGPGRIEIRKTLDELRHVREVGER
jgi:sporulation protein YlmC with PRC-barrel domain